MIGIVRGRAGSPLWMDPKAFVNLIASGVALGLFVWAWASTSEAIKRLRKEATAYKRKVADARRARTGIHKKIRADGQEADRNRREHIRHLASQRVATALLCFGTIFWFFYWAIAAFVPGEFHSWPSWARIAFSEANSFCLISAAIVLFWEVGKTPPLWMIAPVIVAAASWATTLLFIGTHNQEAMSSSMALLAAVALGCAFCHRYRTWLAPILLSVYGLLQPVAYIAVFATTDKANAGRSVMLADFPTAWLVVLAHIKIFWSTWCAFLLRTPAVAYKGGFGPVLARISLLAIAGSVAVGLTAVLSGAYFPGSVSGGGKTPSEVITAILTIAGTGFIAALAWIVQQAAKKPPASEG